MAASLRKLSSLRRRKGFPISGGGLAKSERLPHEPELMEVRLFPFEEALRIILSGEMVDSMTISTVFCAAYTKGHEFM